jgi:Tfp pilus assembly protein PilX
VLIIVLLLIIMFTGFGVLAMRHTQAELRSSGAYLDATQAGDLVEGALALVATDLRSSSDYYEYQYLAAEGSAAADGGVDDGAYEIPLNGGLFGGSDCGDTANPSCIAYLSTSADPAAGLYREMGELYGVSVLTKVTHRQPEVGPCPPGFSCFDDQNYGWYTFTVDATTSYGSSSKSSSTLFELGRAVGKGRMTVGPVSVFGK